MEVYTAASQRHYNVLSQTRMLPGAQALPDAQEICYSLLAAQDSATMQILLEQCLPEYEVMSWVIIYFILALTRMQV